MPPAKDCESSLSQSLLNLPEKKKQSIKHCAQKACASLSALTDLTYNCKKPKVLEDITNKLSELENIVRSSIPKSSGDFLLFGTPEKRAQAF